MHDLAALSDLATRDNGIIRTSVAVRAGISGKKLARLALRGDLLRIAHGQYVFPDALEDEMLSLAYRSKYIIFSHESALFLHGMSDRTPFEHTVTVPSNVKPSRSFDGLCKIYYVKPELYKLGLIVMKTQMGNPIPSYDLERTVCDILRSRNRMSEETVRAALKEYAVRKDKDLPKLEQYAAALRLVSIVRHYLGVLL